MCWPTRTGGPCCAAHLRPALRSANEALPEWDEAAAAYAATDEGHDHLSRLLDQAIAATDFAMVDRYTKALRHGLHHRHAAETARRDWVAQGAAACEDRPPSQAA